MSLYDGTDLDREVVTVSDNKPGSGSSWNSGLKLLQTQIQLKKVGTPASTISRSITKFTNNSMVKRRETPKPVIVNHLPFISGPFDGKDSLFEEFNIVDDYNPLYPNDYEKAKKRKEEEKRRKIEERRSEKGKRKFNRFDDEDDDDYEKEDHKRELEKRTAGAAIAPPKSLTESTEIDVGDDKAGFQPTFGAGSKGLNVAARIMEKYGYKHGLGLGKAEQGMSTALHVEKTSHRGGKIIHEKDSTKEAKNEPSTSVAENIEPITDVLKNPTKVVLLKNMVGPGEVDDDLEPEIKEEMYKFGEVVSVVIFELPGMPEEEAVRIFVEFQKIDQAIKAVVSLHGRFFGGRSLRAAFYDVEKFKNYDLAE